MDSPLSVEARFAADGGVTVISFAWQGRRLPVTGHGRQWPAEDGRHLLVMTPGDRIFELAFAPETGQWRLVRAPAGHAAA